MKSLIVLLAVLPLLLVGYVFFKRLNKSSQKVTKRHNFEHAEVTMLRLEERKKKLPRSKKQGKTNKKRK